jgi:putative ABC transport system ATP-binding protein
VMLALETVGLGGLEQRRIDELSGGQRQRVAIARALVTQAPIVLADEPTGNLDGATAEKVMELMKKINADFGTTFLFSTHDPRVMKYANKIIELKDGRVENVRAV